ncbi:hypothetical protein F5148DRAFT_1147053 [Russula earlei]|uniref:Uncharacterized protein n=1 Tax=Russula earlei TaxID=71964 RepID=A0ACC0UHF8_9AGAM|nr:hypothetical protein F5148DRAFT_1147053 [Russula earlei]
MDQCMTCSHCPTTKVQVLIDEEEACKTAKAKKATKKAMNAAKRKQQELQWENITPTPKPTEHSCPPVEEDDLVFMFADTFLWVQPPTSEFAQLGDTTTSNGGRGETFTLLPSRGAGCWANIKNMTIQRKQHPKNADTQILLSPNADAPVHLSDLDPGPAHKVRQVHSVNGHPKAKDFGADIQDVISAAITHYHADLSMMNSYPNMVTETNWAKAAWKAGCKEKDVDMVPNVNCLCIIMAQSGHLCSDVKTKAKDTVANVFNFQHTYNLTGFPQQTTGRSSFLKSRATQDIINKVWFQNSSKSKPDAIIFCDQYDPFLLVAIVLTLSAMECALNEWRTGSYSPVAFTVADYKHVFKDAHEMLQCFDQATKDLGILLALTFDAEEGSRSHQNSLSEDAVKKAIKEHQNGIDWSNDEDVK